MDYTKKKIKDCAPGKVRNSSGRCVKVKVPKPAKAPKIPKVKVVKPCEPGKVRDAVTKRCIKECLPGEVRNQKGRCVKVKVPKPAPVVAAAKPVTKKIIIKVAQPVVPVAASPKSIVKMVGKRCPKGYEKNKTGDCQRKTLKRVVAPAVAKAASPQVNENVIVKKGDAKFKGLEQFFLKKTKNTEKILKMVCKNAANCLSFGVFNNIVTQYFENFRNTSLIDKKRIKRIGAVSANGMVLQIPFKKGSYTAYNVLKCSAKETADNLFYEFYVGKNFINQYSSKYPCFLDTYDLYKIKDIDSWDKIKKFCDGKLKNIDIANLIERIPENMYKNSPYWANSCSYNKLLCVMIQYVDGVKSFNDVYKQEYATILHDIPSLFYQVYYVLSLLSNVYTHYDLHSSNVLLYKPFKGKRYILMKYHSSSLGTIEFKTEYIVKIIDYGRNYFDNSKTNSNDIIRNHVCTAKECNPSCGYNVGYSMIQGNVRNPAMKNHHIFPNKSNISHDLRFLNIFKNYLDVMCPGLKKVEYEENYGTPEIKTVNGSKINNVHDAKRELAKMLPAWTNTHQHKKYDSTWAQAAEMNIYSDQPYTFKYNVFSDEA